MSTTQGDPSHDLDLVIVYESADTESNFEAENIHALLESEGVKSVLTGDDRFPNMRYEVRVARQDAERAQQIIADALAAGPEGAAEAEEAGESGPV